MTVPEAADVALFYGAHPYPPPRDDLESYRRRWTEQRRRFDSHLFWPHERYRDDRSILVAGCGTVQAAHYALRWPNARIAGIDVSATSIAFATELKRKHGLDNLELRYLPVERAGELGETFEHIVCTGVLHHLADPDAGLRALRGALAPSGAMHLMVYAPYGRSGIYMLQEYCRRLGIGWTPSEIRDLAASLRALPQNHPLAPLLRDSPDFASTTGLADALLHPHDRAYSVSQLMEFLARGGMCLGRWLRQAPYLPSCGALASTPHAALVADLSPQQQYAALELFRGTMVRHSAIAYRDDTAAARTVDFDSDTSLSYVPLRAPDLLVVRERVPQGASAVLINRNHTDTDLYLPIDEREEALLDAADGRRSLAQIAGQDGDRRFVQTFFRRLWEWDHIVVDMSDSHT